VDRHLAQLNIARLRFPLSSPRVAGFVDGLTPMNALADASPGFVWRLQDETGQATAIPSPFGDDVIVNMSVWESIGALRDYAYSTEHLDYLRRRREWFDHDRLGAHLVLWWIPAGHLPTLEEAAQRLAHLVDHGPTGHAFTLRNVFDADGA
jgi:hypothetical protein